jgi:hypothetical protein
MALKRILIRQKLQSMHVEIREQMVYHSPPELGALWTQFEEMRNQIEAEQTEARAKQEHDDLMDRKAKEALMREVRDKSIDTALAIFALIFLGWMMWQLKIQAAEKASFWHT